MEDFDYPDMPVKFLTKEDKFEFTEDYHTPECVIPKGFKTDGASAPRALQGLFPAYYKYFPAAATHDYLYSEAKRSRKECDEIFRDIIKVRLKMSWRYWATMYPVLRLFGWTRFNKP